LTDGRSLGTLSIIVLRRRINNPRTPAMTALPIITDCNDCGACCSQLGTPPFLSYERDLVPDELLAEIDAIEFTQQDENGGPCIWLDPTTRQCRHYDERPFICREFEMGGEDCRNVRMTNESTRQGASLERVY
jgi:uncharacterized protein